MALLPLKDEPQDVAMTADGDIEIGPNGLRLISGIEAVVQAVRIRLLMFRGEWFLNLTVGITYFEDIIGDASKVRGVEDRARAAFAAAILAAPGVLEITRLDVVMTGRKLTVTWAARTAFGDTPPDTLNIGATDVQEDS